MSQDWCYDYFYSENGTKWPIDWSQFPNRIRLSNGMTRTDNSTFTQEEIKDAGWFFVEWNDNYNDITHELRYDKVDKVWVIVKIDDTSHAISRYIKDPNIIVEGNPIGEEGMSEEDELHYAEFN